MVDWSPFTSVYEIPDYLNTDQYPAFKQDHESEIWIGPANGSRMVSMKNSGLLHALEKICRTRPDVKLVLSDVETSEELRNIHPAQIVKYRSNSFEQWADMLLKLDLGLVPIHGDYDLRLGRMNLLEFMISKTSWIASNQPAFHEYSRYGKLVLNSPNAWENVILKAMENIEALRKRVAGEPFLFALSQDLNENIDKVLKLFSHIINQAQ